MIVIKKKYVFFLDISLCVIVLSLGTYAFIQWDTHPPSVLSSKQRQKALEKMLGRAPTLNAPVHSTTLFPYTTSILSFQYPSDAKLLEQSTANTSKDFDEYFSYEIPSTFVVVTVMITSNSSIQTITDLPAVTLRLHQASIYTKTTAPLQVAGALAFVKHSDQSEESLFFMKHAKAVSVVVSGSSFDDIQTEFSRVVNSISFLP